MTIKKYWLSPDDYIKTVKIKDEAHYNGIVQRFIDSGCPVLIPTVPFDKAKFCFHLGWVKYDDSLPYQLVLFNYHDPKLNLVHIIEGLEYES